MELPLAVAQLGFASEISRRQAPVPSICRAGVTIPTNIHGWYHWAHEEVSTFIAQPDWSTEHIEKSFQVSNLEPIRNMQLNFFSYGTLQINYNWIGTHPAMLSETYVTVRFTDKNGQFTSSPQTFYIGEDYRLNNNVCKFHIDRDADHRQMHVQVTVRPLGHHDV